MRVSVLNYYQHHIGDFIRDTSRLSDSQCMAYLRLIWGYYETEQPLENDIDAIAFKSGANASDVHQILKHFFFLHDDGLWHQSRCDKEILAFRKKSDKAKKSADARWNNANAMRTHTERTAFTSKSDANQEPVTSIEKETTVVVSKKSERRCKLPDDFYPNETGIAKAKDSGIDITCELDRFKDYHNSKGSVMLDWQAAWRTWVSNAVKFSSKTKTTNEKPYWGQ